MTILGVFGTLPCGWTTWWIQFSHVLRHCRCPLDRPGRCQRRPLARSEPLAKHIPPGTLKELESIPFL
jgi:hypothetical protein